MKNMKKYLISLLFTIIIACFSIPAQASAATTKYGIIIGDKDNKYQLVNNLVVTSPEKNLMIKAYSVCNLLGLTYSYNSETKKLSIKNPVNGKRLVYVLGNKNYTYYSSSSSKGVTKTAAYKFYYDSISKSYVVHMSTLRYILTYNYYSNITDTYYPEMGYKALIAYSINGYTSYDIPVTDELINFVNGKYFTTKDELLDAVRLNAIAHKTGFILNTNREVMNEIGDQDSVYDLLVNIDNKDTSKDADYLGLAIEQIKWGWSSAVTVRTYPNGSKETIESEDDPASLTVNVKYRTTMGQEWAVDSKIPSILKSLKLKDASDYTKVKKIHDYIINLARYDTTLRRSTTYDILINKTAVCAGYATAAYRLFTDAGLDCRIITGYGNGDSHAWNIVKVDGKWYNIDLTWDDPLTPSGEQLLKYDYFLKNEAGFKNHERDTQFCTSEFLKAYPIADESY